MAIEPLVYLVLLLCITVFFVNQYTVIRTLKTYQMEIFQLSEKEVLLSVEDRKLEWTLQGVLLIDELKLYQVLCLCFRAIYSKADIYLLDDPLSAVDAAVSRHLFDRYFNV